MNLNPKYIVDRVDKGNGHGYTVDKAKTYLPGVTTILQATWSKPYLMRWASKVTAKYVEERLKSRFIHRKGTAEPFTKEEIEDLCHTAKVEPTTIADTSADLGTRAHAVFDRFVLGEDIQTYDSDLETVVKSFKSWRSTKRIKFLKGDTKVISLKHGFGGTFDAMAIDHEGELQIFDFKSSNYLGDDYALQLAPYAFAAQEIFDLEYLPACHVVRFGKKKVEFEEKRVLDVERSFTVFKHLLFLYEEKKKSPWELPGEKTEK